MSGMPMKSLPVPVPAVLTAGVLAGAIAMVGCTSGGSPAPAGSSAAGPAAATGQGDALHWRSCSVEGVPMRCASLRVPLDYSHPSGRKITLALSEVPATAPAAQQLGDLLVNPGGPGASGRSLAAVVATRLNRSVSA
jgi:hypothetical protein